MVYTIVYTILHNILFFVNNKLSIYLSINVEYEINLYLSKTQKKKITIYQKIVNQKIFSGNDVSQTMKWPGL